MDRDQNVEETFDGLELGLIHIASRSIAKRHECDPIHHESSPSLIVLFQQESLSELVYAQQTQILALRDRRKKREARARDAGEEGGVGQVIGRV